MADRGADVDGREVVACLHLESTVAVGVADGADAANVADDAGEHQILSYRSQRSAPTDCTSVRWNLGAEAKSFKASVATAGRPSSPSTIGARNHSMASTSPPFRKLAATWPPPSIITAAKGSCSSAAKAASGSTRPSRSDTRITHTPASVKRLFASSVVRTTVGTRPASFTSLELS